MSIERSCGALWLAALIWLLTACDGRKSVGGRVLDERGNAIAGVDVELDASNVRRPVSTPTAEDGSYGVVLRFGWRPGSFTVTAQAPGYKPMVASLDGGDGWCDFVLAPIGSPAPSAVSCTPAPP